MPARKSSVSFVRRISILSPNPDKKSPAFRVRGFPLLSVTLAATGAQQAPPSGNLSPLFRFGGPVKPQSRCVVHDQKIPRSARVLTMRPPRREDFALSPEIGQSTARFQAHTLWPTATGTPSHANSATWLTAPIRKKVPTMKIETKRIPELVLAITCDKRPQRPHTAGCGNVPGSGVSY